MQLEKKQERLIENENTEEVVTIEEDMETKDAQLWVDKYRPQSYVDLLSEEPVNRALLHWLHLWDKVRIIKTYHIFVLCLVCSLLVGIR